MSYQITYEKERTRKQGKRRRSYVFPLTLVALMVFMLFVNAYWPEGQAVLRRYLLPGDPEAAVSAFNSFAQELKAGENFPDALRNFWQEVMELAGLAGH